MFVCFSSNEQSKDTKWGRLRRERNEIWKKKSNKIIAVFDSVKELVTRLDSLQEQTCLQFHSTIPGFV